MARQRELSIVKDNERFVFRYEAGHEESVLDAFVDLANDRDNKFDWFDAAVLSFQLSKQLVSEADKLLCVEDLDAEKASGSPKPWNCP